MKSSHLKYFVKIPLTVLLAKRGGDCEKFSCDEMRNNCGKLPLKTTEEGQGGEEEIEEEKSTFSMYISMDFVKAGWHYRRTKNGTDGFTGRTTCFCFTLNWLCQKFSYTQWHTAAHHSGDALSVLLQTGPKHLTNPHWMQQTESRSNHLLFLFKKRPSKCFPQALCLLDTWNKSNANYAVHLKPMLLFTRPHSDEVKSSSTFAASPPSLTSSSCPVSVDKFLKGICWQGINRLQWSDVCCM